MMNWKAFKPAELKFIADVIKGSEQEQRDLVESLSHALETSWSLPKAALETLRENGYIIVKDSTVIEPIRCAVCGKPETEPGSDCCYTCLEKMDDEAHEEWKRSGLRP